MTLGVQGEPVSGVAFSPNGGLIATWGLDRAIRLWDSESGKEVRRMSTKGRIRSIAFSPDGERLVTAYSEDLEGIGAPSMKIWEIESGRELLSVKAHGDRIEGVAWSRTGDRIVSASLDESAGLVGVWGSFPYRLEDYPGQPDSPLLERTQLYAAEYWRRRIAVENLTATRPTSRPYSRAVAPRRDWFPSRDPNSGPDQLDLSEYYNAQLNVSWHPTQRGSVWFGWDLFELPTGLVTLSNVAFDVRGVVQLADNQWAWQDHFETRVNGIRVDRRLKRLQILHGANMSSRFASVSDQAAG